MADKLLVNNMKTLIMVTLFILFLSLISMFFFYMLEVSNERLYDDSNTYINGSSGDYLESYEINERNKGILLNISYFFNESKNILIVLFFFIFLLGFFVTNRDSVINYIHKIFERFK